MLRRKITDYLIEWKNSPDKKCLLIKGARQVGKTYIVDEFAKANYSNYIYMNFELNPTLCDIFADDLDVDSIMRRMSVRFPRVKTEPGKTLIFLDEIQNCPRARTAFKSFTTDGRFDVIGSGSLLGVRYRDVPSYPAGYEQSVEMHSLDFEEFLWAHGIDDGVLDSVKKSISGKTPIDGFTLKVLNDHFKWYMLTGGMPEAVKTYISTHNFGMVLRVQQDIMNSYLDDVTKYAPASEKAKVRDCFQSIPCQLGKRNKKFTYSEISGERTAKSRTYEGSLMWLFDAGIISYCYNLQEPALPLTLNIRRNSFKIYLRDTGLLMSMMNEEIRYAVVNDGFRVNEGSITENMVAEQFTKKGLMLTYFEKKGTLEIGFILNLNGNVTALEVKSGDNRQSKSLDSVMSDKYGVKRGIKLENSNIYTDDSGVEHYPLFVSAFIEFAFNPRSP